MSGGGKGARAWGVIGRGLWLPAELYLQPHRFEREVEGLGPEGRWLTERKAFGQARSGSESRGELVDLLLRVVIAIAWPFVLSAVLDALGVPIAWSGVAFIGAFGVAGGIAFALAFGLAFGVALGVATGVAAGIAAGIAFAVNLEVASGVALGVGFGVAVAVAIGGPIAREAAIAVATGVGLGVATGVVGGVEGGIAFGVAFGVAAGIFFVVASLRLLLAPFEIVVARRMAGSMRKGVPPPAIWARHPARWDPHGRFPLPGLVALLAELQLRHPAVSVEAIRIVAANPTRRHSLAPAALLAIDRVVGRVATLSALGALAQDLDPLSSGDLLASGERAELDLVHHVSEDVAASLTAESAINRVARLRGAEARLRAPNPASAVIARHRPGLVALVGEALVAAELEQRQREPVPQVYRATGTPLDLGTELAPTTFKGRRAVFEQLEALLGTERRETVILHGPRRYGKTSLLKQLPARLGPSVIPVFVNLQGDLGAAESATTLLGGLADEVVAQARTQRKLGDLPTLGAEALATEPYVAFGRWLDQVERALGDRHVLLCLDEFEKLQEQIEGGRLDTRVLDLLRAIAQHRRRVTVVLTGVRSLAELPRVWASTLVSATSIEVGPLDRTDAVDLVERPVPGFPAVYGPDAVDAILAASACLPFLVQVLCSVVVDELNRRRWHPGDPPVGADDVATALAAAVDRADNYFIDVWSNQVPAAARSLVRDLAASGCPTVDATDDELVEAVLSLERRRIVARTPAGFALVVPLFAEYVRTRQSVA